MSHIQLIGIDPGFAAVGLGVINVSKEGSAVCCGFELFRTKKEDKKRRVLQSDDNFRRGVELVTALDAYIESKASGAVAICAESMSHPRNASASGKVGICWGILAALSLYKKLPVLQLGPKQVKIAVCGNPKAGKPEVQDEMRKRYPQVEAFDEKLGQAKEHPYDALAVATSCIEHDFVRMMRVRL